MKHPEHCYSNDLSNNCIILKWGESGYFKTDYPEGGYTDEIIDEMNALGGITKAERGAMECCAIASQGKPNFNWEEHYKMCLDNFNKHVKEN